MEQVVDIEILTRMLGERELRCELMRRRIAELEARVAELDHVVGSMANRPESETHAAI